MFQLTKALIRKFVVLLFLIMKSVSVSRRFRYTHLSILQRCITNVAGKGYTKNKQTVSETFAKGYPSENSSKMETPQETLLKEYTVNKIFRRYSTKTPPEMVHHKNIS